MQFINGKVFIQNGKLLRPARVVFSDYDMNYHRERLAPKLYPKRNKKKHRPGTFKDNLSPTKSCNLSSDEFKSDIEEEDKGRFKSGNLKSPRINRKKSVSPKHNDKTLSKCILMDLKLDQSDCEEKCVVGKSVDLSLGKDEEKLSSRLGTDFDFQHKNEPNDFCILLTEQTKKQSESEETDGSAEKLMNLPKIDSEDDSHISVKPADNQDLLTNCIVKSQALTFLDRERSNSPPVISIPETSNSTFANSKPILSLLENLDDTKNSPVFLDSVGDKNTTTKESFKKELKDVKKEEVNLPWKIEEDRVILQTLQVEKNCEETFMKIGKNIPTRKVEDIKKRFDELMNMLYEMKAKTGNS